MKLSELLKAIQPVQIIGSMEKDNRSEYDSRVEAASHIFCLWQCAVVRNRRLTYNIPYRKGAYSRTVRRHAGRNKS